jgi:putative drug exporter of the RND superfamily
VGGITAVLDDFSHAIASKFRWFIAFVLVLSFVILVLAFRSLLIPLLGAVMNLLSTVAAFGVVVAVFQWGWGAGVLGVEKDPIEPFIPVLAFAILFGLPITP